MNNASITKSLQTVRMGSVHRSPLQLNVGQIITGKLESFLPHNKAIIQINNQTLIAQLENQLHANQRYVFQATQISPFIKLRVVSEKPVRSQKDTITVLLEKLGVKSTENRMSLLSYLIDRDIPIQRDSFVQAIQLLESTGNKNQGMQVIVELLERNLSLTKQVYEAMYSRMFETIPLSHVSERIFTNLTNEETIETFQLMLLLSLLHRTGWSPSINQFFATVLHEAEQNSSITFNILKKAGILSNELSFESWKKSLKDWVSQNRTTTEQMIKDLLKQQAPTKTVLPIDSMEQLYVKLKQLWSAGQNLSKQETAILNRWLLHGEDSLIKLGELSLQDSLILKFKGVFSIFDRVNPEEQTNQRYSSLKSLLKMVMNNIDLKSVHKEVNQIINIITALQLSISEQNEWNQFSVQFPGEMFGLKEDFVMDFEGKKDIEHKIDPDYCHIMFYLNMNNLKETIIDMKVQNKIVTINLYHQNPKILSPVVKLLQPELVKNMLEMDYRISSVSVKSINQEKSKVNRTLTAPKSITGKGVDFQV